MYLQNVLIALVILLAPYFFLYLRSKTEEKLYPLIDLFYLSLASTLTYFWLLPQSLSEAFLMGEIAAFLWIYLISWLPVFGPNLKQFLDENKKQETGSLPFFFFFFYFFYKMGCLYISAKPLFLLFLFVFVLSLAFLILNRELLKQMTHNLVFSSPVQFLLSLGLHVENSSIIYSTQVIDSLGFYRGALFYRILVVISASICSILFSFFFNLSTFDLFFVCFSSLTLYARLKCEFLSSPSVSFGTVEEIRFDDSNNIVNDKPIVGCISIRRNRSYSTLVERENLKNFYKRDKVLLFFIPKRHVTVVLRRITTQMATTVQEAAGALYRGGRRTFQNAGEAMHQNPQVVTGTVGALTVGVGVAGIAIQLNPKPDNPVVVAAVTEAEGRMKAAVTVAEGQRAVASSNMTLATTQARTANALENQNLIAQKTLDFDAKKLDFDAKKVDLDAKRLDLDAKRFDLDTKKAKGGFVGWILGVDTGADTGADG